MRLVLLAAAIALALPASAQDASPFPTGLYQPAPPAPPSARMLFGDGTFEISSGMMVIASGDYVATAQHLVLLFGDDNEDCAMPGQETGIYAWSDAGGVVTLSVVDDACQGRGEALSASTLTLVGGPAEE